MHVLLTDLLTCPRCGPGFGLVLLADRVEERRVLEGSFGCPNCRDAFPVGDGFGDLRSPPRPDPVEGERLAPDTEEPVRLAALLGVTSGPGHVALLGDVAAAAPGLADLLDNVEAVAVSAGARGWSERPGVSRLVARPGLPFHDRTLRGVALGGPDVERLLDEAVRVVGASARVVVLDAPDGTAHRLERSGLTPILDEAGVVVASR